MGVALSGLTYLVWLGIAWVAHSVRGRRAATPILSTTGNFVRAAPLAAIASVIFFSLIHVEIHVEAAAILLALVSGMLTSGLAYVLWHRVLGSITTTQAAIVQLLVPVLAAFGGVGFLAEGVSVRLAVASVVIVGGVGMAVLNRCIQAGLMRPQDARWCPVTAFEGSSQAMHQAIVEKQARDDSLGVLPCWTVA